MRRPLIYTILLIISIGAFSSRFDLLVVSEMFARGPQIALNNSAVNGSATPLQLRNQTYSRSFYDVAYSGIETQDGGLAILGCTNPPGSINLETDFWLIKTDPNGNLLWSRTYGGDTLDCAFSVIQTTDGGFALGGYTYSYGSVAADGWLIKTDTKGKVQWKRTYGGYSDDIAQTVIQTADGGYLLGGWTVSGSGYMDGWLVKTDRKGNEEWHRFGGGGGWDEITAVRQTPDGGYLFVGENSMGESVTPQDLWVGKTNATGELLWNYTYGGRGDDSASSLIEITDGTYVITGRTTTYGSGKSDFWLLKMNPSGIVDWNQTYGGIDTDFAYSVVQTTDGGYALLGLTESFGTGSDDFWLVKTDTIGTYQWNQTYGSSGNERGFCLIPTSDGGLVMIGYTEPHEIFNSSYLVIKVGGKLTPTTQPETSRDFPLFHVGLPLLGIALLILLPLLIWWWRKTRGS